MNTILNKLTKKLKAPTKGQGLVETAIIAPIAIFMLIGVFEVGWSLRNYVVLVNSNRETTRFAVRPGYLDYSIKDASTVGYDRVLTHAHTTIADQLPTDFDTNSKLIISHMVIETNLPCDPEEVPDINDCNCDDFVDPATNFNASQVYTYDDKILHPLTPGQEYYIQAYPTHTITATQINFEQEAEIRKRENNKFNCEILKKGGLLSTNNYIITEMFYDQPQLFGFPLISNPLTDPVPLYTHTTMRMVSGSRSSEDMETDGPVCAAYPIVVHKDTIEWPTKNKVNHKVDIFDGNGPNDFGWLAWNPDNTVGNNTPYLRDELRTANAALNDFTNARDPSDHMLSVGDWVSSLPGDKAAVESSDGMLSKLIGKQIRIPIWDTFEKGLGTQRDAYHIVGFAWARIEQVSDINIPGKTIVATYLGDATDACTDTAPGGGGGGGGGSTPTPTPTPTDKPGGGPKTSTPTPTTSPPTATPTMATPTATPTTVAATLHVNSIDVTVSKSGSDYKATVVVTVADASGSPVQGAVVQGTWSGSATGSVSGTTNSSGQVTFETDWQKNEKGPYTFKVDNITKDGWTYNAGANVETQDSGSY